MLHGDELFDGDASDASAFVVVAGFVVGRTRLFNYPFGVQSDASSGLGLGVLRGQSFWMLPEGSLSRLLEEGRRVVDLIGKLRIACELNGRQAEISIAGTSIGCKVHAGRILLMIPLPGSVIDAATVIGPESLLEDAIDVDPALVALLTDERIVALLHVEAE